MLYGGAVYQIYKELIIDLACNFACDIRIGIINFNSTYLVGGMKFVPDV
jgi:hypothetical protein